MQFFFEICWIRSTPFDLSEVCDCVWLQKSKRYFNVEEDAGKPKVNEVQTYDLSKKKLKAQVKHGIVKGKRVKRLDTANPREKVTEMSSLTFIHVCCTCRTLKKCLFGEMTNMDGDFDTFYVLDRLTLFLGRPRSQRIKLESSREDTAWIWYVCCKAVL